MPVVDEIARAVLAIRRPHPTRVCIDGRSAAGKSTFAQALKAALVPSGRQVLLAEVDNFHVPGHAARSRAGTYTPQTLYDESYDLDAVRRHLIAPLGAGGDRRLRLALHDSFHDRPIEGTEVTAAPDAIVIVEGIFLLRPEFRDAWDVAIWIDISFETVMERAAKRDVAWVGDETAVREKYRLRWIPAHQLYEATGPRSAAHFVIDNEDPLQPQISVQRRPR